MEICNSSFWTTIRNFCCFVGASNGNFKEKQWPLRTSDQTWTINIRNDALVDPQRVHMELELVRNFVVAVEKMEMPLNIFSRTEQVQEK